MEDPRTAVARELWVSLTSMVRSYVAVLQVVSGAPAAEVVASDPSTFELRSSRRVLRMQFAEGSSQGTWAMLPWPAAPEGSPALQSGRFSIEPDGRVSWSGLTGPTEMDQVAESVATMMMAG